MTTAYTLPDASTISRWRMLVDGAYMIYWRSLNASSSYIRYLMADSSSQRGRNFELIALLCIREDEIVDSYRRAKDLAQLWSWSLKTIVPFIS